MQNPFLDKFLEHARTMPDKPALIDGSRSYTWKEAERLSGQVYAYLKDHRIGLDQFVGVKLKRNAETAVCFIGVLRNGSAFVSLDTESVPSFRTDFIQKDCDCKFIIDEEQLERIRCYRCELGYETAALDSNIALAIYTSGSTGFPKGVLQERGVLREAQKKFSDDVEAVFETGSRHAFITPFYWACFLMFFFKNLYAGGVSYIVPLDVVHDSCLLENFLFRHQILAVFLPVSLVSLFVEKDYPRVIFTGGEISSFGFRTNKKIFNCYGASEAMFLQGICKVDPDAKSSALFFPQKEHAVHLLDENGNEVKDGDVGELCFYNPYFRGYINHPEKTSEVFFPGKIFRSHDEAKRISENEVQIVGRKDDMFKIRGKRVEPGEIEVVFKKIASVELCVVRCFEIDKRFALILFYADGGNGVVRQESLWREEMRKILPDYMIPTYFVPVENFPRLDNGKINRRALECPDLSKLRPEYIAPTSKIETDICRAIENVLDVKDVGLNDEFELLGGDSVTAMDLLVELSEYGIESEDISRGKSVRGIARILLNKKKRVTDDVSVAGKSRQMYMLLPSQEHMFLQQLKYDKSSPLWLNTSFELPSNVDLQKFADAVDETIRIHPAFLFKVVHVGEEFRQTYCPELFQKTEIEDVSEPLPERLKRFFKVREILDASLCFTRIFRTAENAVFALSVNHSLIDGTSLGLFFGDVERIYKGLAPSRDFYFDALEDYEAYRKSDEGKQLFERVLLQEQDAFADYAVVPKQDFTGSWGAVVRTAKVPVPEFLRFPMEMYAFVYALAVRNFNKCDKVAFVVTHHGKNSERQKTTCGNFTFDLLILLDFAGRTVADVFVDMKRQLHNAVNVPYRPVVSAMSSVIYQSNIFSMQVLGVNAVESYLDSEFEIAENALNVHFFKEDSSIKMFLEYDSARFCAESMNAFVDEILKAADLVKSMLGLY